MNFIDDENNNQIVGGLAAAFSIFFGAVLTLIIPLAEAAQANIFYVLTSLGIITAGFYLIPSLSAKRELRLIPGLIYIAGTAVIVNLAGAYGYLFALFLLLLLAVAAFVYSLTEFIFIVVVTVVAILSAALYPDLVLEAEYTVGLYVSVALAIVLRLFANEAVRNKQDKMNLFHDVEELETDKKEIRTLLESLSDGLFVVNNRDKITFYNPAALQILGITAAPEKILGRDINDFMPTVGENGPEPITREVFGSLEHSIRNDFRIITAKETIRLHTNISPVVIDKINPKGAVIFFRDITHEKRIEEQRAEFNAVASHELRTPLSVIEGYLFYVLDPSSKLKYDKETREYIERAHEAATELNSLVTDILTVVKADQGELEVSLKKLDPVTFFGEIVRSHETKAKDKKIKLTFEVVAHEKMPEIVTDPVKAKEILNNLVGNAIKFTDKGSVKVELGLLKKEIIITVIDTGIGISKEDQSGIYRKFFRAENWRTR
jgi:PAS domain S-box-containing protein